MINEHSNIINMETKNFNYDHAYVPNNFYLVKSNVYYHDGVNYYAKRVYDEESIINELIGSYLSKLIDLEAVDYKIGVYNDSVYMLSELFYDDSFDYRYVDKSYCNFDLEKIKKKYFVDNIPEEYPYIRDKILKLALLDIKMCQYDRCSETNITIKKSKVSNYTDLAPIYDFSFSYPTSFADEQLVVYYNIYLAIRKNAESLKLLVKKYPQVKDTLNKLANIEMKTIISDIQDEQRINISNKTKNNLLEQDYESTKILKKII